MKNYALEWKQGINLGQVSYEEFVTEHSDAYGIYMEKIDGMLGVLIYDKKTLAFQSTTGNLFEDLPVLFEYKSYFEKHGIDEAIIPGELVSKSFGTILPFNETQSIVKKSYLEKNKPLIYHYPYDIISLNKRSYSFEKGISFIMKSFKHTSEHINLINVVKGDLEDFRKLYHQVKDKPGFDGVVGRDISGKNYKVKFTGTIDLVVIGGGKEGLPAWNKWQVSYLLTSFLDKDGIYRSSSKVGTGFTEQKRIQMYKYLKENELYNKDGEIFVKPNLVLEMKFFRYRLTDTPAYKFKNRKYEGVGDLKSITFSHPSFERLRLDKKSNKYDIRLEQLPEWEY